MHVPFGLGDHDSRNSRAFFVAIALAITAALTGRQALGLIGAYLSAGRPTTLRADDYWSYSSGFGRRGLLGELLFRSASFLGTNTSVFLSALFVAVYAALTWQLLRRITRRADAVSLLLLVCGPLVFNFSVDREVLLLVPISLLAASESSALLRLVGYALAPVCVLVHELALVIYPPVLLALHRRDGRWWRLSAPLAATGTAVALAAVVMSIGNHPSYLVERSFWPAFGITALESSHLYSFATMSFTQMLSNHAKHLCTQEGLVSVLFAMLLVYYIVASVRHQRPLFLAALLSLPPFLTLCIDYGRYAYILFTFYFLASRVQAEVAIDTGHAPEPTEAQCEFLARDKRWVLLSLVICPIAFYVGAPASPTPMRMVKELGRLLGISGP